jgi:hypothetical protein
MIVDNHTKIPVFCVINKTNILSLFPEMKIIEQITSAIDRFPTDFVFTYTDVAVERGKEATIVKSLNRLAAADVITKLSKGKYYKPRQTQFGALKPSPYQITKDFIEKDSKLIGYLTGYSVFNDLGLTTQISNTLQIGTNKYRRAVKREIYTISFIVQPNTITKDNIGLLRILDAVRLIKEIPATTPNEACTRLKEIFRELTPEKRAKLTNLALQYTNSVRALCGAILESVGTEQVLLDKLQKSLNGVTDYKIPISENILPTKTKWRLR